MGDMRGSRNVRQGGPDNVFFSHQPIIQRAVRISLETQLDPMGPIASRWGSVPEF